MSPAFIKYKKVFQTHLILAEKEPLNTLPTVKFQLVSRILKHPTFITNSVMLTSHVPLVSLGLLTF